jgi:hypothetical protein
MDIQAVSTIVSSAATAVYAVIAFLTLRHLSRESAESRRPYVVVYVEGNVAVSSSYSQTDGLLLGSSAKQRSPASGFDLNTEGLPVIISNAGGGAALNIRLKWSCDGLVLERLLTEVERSHSVNFERSEHGWLQIGGLLFNVTYDADEIAYLASVAPEASTQRLSLPSAIERRLELMLASRPIDQFFVDVRSVYLNVECQYFDRFGRSYTNHYRFRSEPQSGRAHSTGGTVLVRFALERID